jgi:hypothetical protein
VEEPKGDMQNTRNYNRGYTISFSNWGKFRPQGNISSIDYNFFASMRRENSMKSRLNTGYVILPSGDTVSTYLGKVQTRGVEWTIGGRLEWNELLYTGSVIHKVTAGVDPQYNANTGEGLLLDTLLNYYGAASGKRSYSFDDIPGQFLTSIYLEDKLTGHFLFDFTLQAGFRYEMYNPYDVNISGLWGSGDLVKSHQGTFFNPRANLVIYTSERSQFRLSAGASSKSPAMAMMYPPPSVFPWRNPGDSVNNYLRYERRLPELKGYKETLYEVSYDQDFSGKLGVTLTAYYQKRRNEPKAQSIPVFQLIKSGSSEYLAYIDSYSLYYNIGRRDTKGIELALRTVRIKPLNMDLQITGSYNYTDIPATGYYYSSSPDLDYGQTASYPVSQSGIDTIIGLTYPQEHKWSDYLQLNYYIKYTFAPFGLWITLRAEHLVWERSQTSSNKPIEFTSANEGTVTSYYFAREVKTKPAKWLLNLSMSKSLFKGAEVSFYVNNFIDDPAKRRYYSAVDTISEETRNPEIFYGIEFSMIMEDLF